MLSLSASLGVIIFLAIIPLYFFLFLFTNLITLYVWWTGEKDIRYFIIPQKQNEKVVYITIDDVPYSSVPMGGADTYSTREILNVLHKHHACATLFVIGSFLSSAPSVIVKAIYETIKERTVVLANHGMTDSQHWKLSREKLGKEIDDCTQVIKDQFKKNDVVMLKAYRPGCGFVNPTVMGEAKKRNLKVTLGNIYSFDAQIRFPLFHLIALSLSIRPGAIVVIHDRPWTPWTLDWFLRVLHLRGYRTKMLPP